MELIKFLKLLDVYFPAGLGRTHTLSWASETEELDILIWVDNEIQIITLDSETELDDAELLLDSIIKIFSDNSQIGYVCDAISTPTRQR